MTTVQQLIFQLAQLPSEAPVLLGDMHINKDDDLLVEEDEGVVWIS